MPKTPRDPSLERVTLHAAFLFDVIDEYAGLGKVAAPLIQMGSHLERSRPMDLVPLTVYLDACDWVEETFGEASVREAGHRIGRRVMQKLKARGRISDPPHPHELVQELAAIGAIVIQDPQHRGWELQDVKPQRIVVRRTLPTNCILNEGLLAGLVERSTALMPSVTQLACIRSGAPACEFELRWLLKKR